MVQEEEQVVGAEESAPQPVCQGTGIPPSEMAFRPLTRIERRNLWIKEYGEQDFALQMWTRLVEQQDLEIEMMLQMHGLLVFGVMVSTLRYAQFCIDLNEELHRENEPETADALRDYYLALVPPRHQPVIGSEGLPVVSHYIHRVLKKSPTKLISKKECTTSCPCDNLRLSPRSQLQTSEKYGSTAMQQ